jgi:2-dehydropantoate 2-reductase
MSHPIYVVGPGAVGAFVAARLFTVDQVVLVARDSTVAKFKNGITLTGKMTGHYSVPCVGWSELPKFPEGSIVLIASKIFQLKEILAEVSKRGPAHLVLLQNGIGITEEASRHLPGTNFGRGVCWFGIRIDRPAELCVTGIQGIEIAGGPAEPMRYLAEKLNAAGIPTVDGGSVQQIEWKKALWNIANNALCALAKAPNGATAESPWLRPLAEEIVTEALAVANAEGVALGSEDRERVFKSSQMTRTNLNSTLQDVSAGRRTEVEWINGAVVRGAAKHGISAPMNTTLYRIVKYIDEHPCPGPLPLIKT